MNRSGSSSFLSRHWFIGIWLVIVFFALITRLWRLGNLPVSLNFDEVAILVDMKAIAQTGSDMHGRRWYQVIYPSYGDYKQPMYVWLAATSAKLIGASAFSVRLPNALAGVVTVMMMGWLSRVLLQAGTTTEYSQKHLQYLQIWVMGVVAISPWSILFSRTAFPEHLGQALFATSIAFLAWSLSRSQRFRFWISPFLGAAATYSYFSVAFVWPVVYLLVSGLIILQTLRQIRKSSKNDWTFARKKAVNDFIQVCFGLVIFLVLLLPLFNSPLAKETQQPGLSTDSVSKSTVVQLAKNYSKNFSFSFLFLDGDSNLQHGTTQHGLFLVSFIVPFLIGCIILGRRHGLLFSVLIIWWLVASLPASLSDDTPQALSSLNSLLPITIIIGIGCWQLWQLRQKTKVALFKNMAPVIQVLIVVILSINFIHFWLFYSTIYPRLSADDWQSGYQPLAEAVIDQSAHHQVWVALPDDLFYLWLMAYGPYTARDWQSWTSNDFKFSTSEINTHLPSIHLETLEPEVLAATLIKDKTLSIAGKTENVTKLCRESLADSCSVKIIKDEAGREKFAMVTFVLSDE